MNKKEWYEKREWRNEKNIANLNLKFVELKAAWWDFSGALTPKLNLVAINKDLPEKWPPLLYRLRYILLSVL